MGRFFGLYTAAGESLSRCKLCTLPQCQWSGRHIRFKPRIYHDKSHRTRHMQTSCSSRSWSHTFFRHHSGTTTSIDSARSHAITRTWHHDARTRAVSCARRGSGINSGMDRISNRRMPHTWFQLKTPRLVSWIRDGRSCSSLTN